ncbi:MAG TPA: porin OmpL1 [Spirochaetota bacterium]|nr:porin OmpL1 [Spirochaetota bacterium]
MKKLYVVLLALALAVSFGTAAMAKDGLSAGIGFGAKFDPNGLGGTVLKDGLERQGSTFDVILAENALTVMDNKGMIKDLEANGAMTAMDIALNARYDFLGKLFARVGFNYNFKVMGGDTSWKYSNTSGIVAWDNGVTAVGAANAKASQVWDYAAWAIPVTIGLNLPIADGKFNAYAGVGFTYASATWSVEVKQPAGILGVMGAANATLTAGQIGALQLNPAVKEKVEFDYSGLGFNFLIGFDAEVAENISVFIELENQYVAGMSDAQKIKSASAITALGTDQIAYPVVPGGQIVRFGAKYFIGTPWM